MDPGSWCHHGEMTAKTSCGMLRLGLLDIRFKVVCLCGNTNAASWADITMKPQMLCMVIWPQDGHSTWVIWLQRDKLVSWGMQVMPWHSGMQKNFGLCPPPPPRG